MSGRVVYARINSPIASIWVARNEVGVCAVGLAPEQQRQPERFFESLSRQGDDEPPREDAAALSSVLTQLSEYFSRVRRRFDLPLDISGTPFQKAVWQAVTDIPYGATATYGEIADQIGRPLAARAVGAALGANRLPILIPCHRVIGASGKLLGYSAGVDAKAALLQLEGVLLS